jgi:molybdenum-dependent DNA-binding transcriptional regulator ModE
MSKRKTEYSSIRSAARKLGVNHATLLNYVDNDNNIKLSILLKERENRLNN